MADRQYGYTFAAFSILAILIACMGLFGLTMFTASNRTKEIGVRKVMGASVSSIVRLLNFESIKLILIASLLGIPLSWYLINKWLDGYAFKIDLEWWMFLTPVFIVMFLSLITISYLTIKAAIANPVKSLRYE